MACVPPAPSGSLLLGRGRGPVQSASGPLPSSKEVRTPSGEVNDGAVAYPPTGATLFIASFSRRRSTEDGIRSPSRYLATVRRAMSMPASRSFWTMASSDSTSSGALGVDHLLDAVAHRLGRMRVCRRASPEIAAVKKYFISKMPRGVATYLFEVTRETVDSCMPIASATVRRFSGRRCSTPWTRKPSCWRTISVATLRMVLGALLQAARQPVRRLQAVGEIGLVRFALGRARRPWRSRSG